MSISEEKDMNLVDAAFQMLIATTSDMIFVKNMDLVYMAASEGFARLAGQKSSDDVVGRTDFEIFTDENLAIRYTHDDRELFTRNEDLLDIVEPLPDENGNPRYGSTSKYILRNDKGEQIGLLGVTKDITVQYIARQNHQRELKYLFNLPENTYFSIFVDVDRWRILGERKQTVRGCTVHSANEIDIFVRTAFLNIIDKDSKEAAFYRDFSKESLRKIYASGVRDFEMEYRRKIAGEYKRWVRDEIRFITEPESGHLCLMLLVHDIDEEKQESINLRVAAQMDGLTGLLNRITLKKQIEEYLKQPDEEKMHALYMIDLDNFKKVNDTYGHQEGDKCLRRLAEAINKSFRKTDIAGRVGGDEFLVLQKNASDISEVENKGKELLKTIASVCGEHTALELSASIGVSIYQRDGRTLEELYAKADKAMYEAKRRGKNQLVFTEEI